MVISLPSSLHLGAPARGWGKANRSALAERKRGIDDFAAAVDDPHEQRAAFGRSLAEWESRFPLSLPGEH